MRPSTAILWRMRLWLVGGCAMLLAGLCFLTGILGGVGTHFGPVFAAVLAGLMTPLLGLRVFLLRLARFFPVDERQLAWMPLAFFGVIWLAGMVGLLAGQCLNMIGQGERWSALAGFWISELIRLPFLSFIIVALLQYSDLGIFWQLYFAGFIIYLLQGDHWVTAPAVEPLVFLESLFFLGGSAILVLAAPAHWAGLRRQTITWHEGESLHSPYSIEEGGRKLSTPLLDLAGALIALPVVYVVLRLIWTYGPGFVWQQVVEITRGHFGIEDFWLLWLLWYLLIDLPLAVVNVYARARASGFAPGRAMLLTLLRLTFVLAPLARRLGLQRGELVQCPACGRKKFVWQNRCPHCEEIQEASRPALPWGSTAPQWPQTHRPAPEDWFNPGALDETLIYRYIIPCVLLGLAMLLRN